MKRNLKIFGLVLVSLLAFGAPTGSAAEFHAGSAPMSIYGEKTANHVFTTDAGTVECSTVKFSGEMTAKTQAEISLSPTYESCEAFFFVNVPVHVNGCRYRYQASGTSEISCPAGKKIEVTAPGCTTTVGPQHFATGVTFTSNNNVLQPDIIKHVNLSGIKYTECGTPKSNGTYHGSTTLTGSTGLRYV